MDHDHLTQSEIIDRLSVYTAQITLDGDADSDDHTRDGIVVGLAIAIAIAAGIDGPKTGRELAQAGADLASIAYARISAERLA